MKCEHGCGTELDVSRSYIAGGREHFTSGRDSHTPERCRDAFKKRYEEAEYGVGVERRRADAAEERAAEAEDGAVKAVAKWSLVRADHLDAESKLREVSAKRDGLQLALSEQMEERAEYARALKAANERAERLRELSEALVDYLLDRATYPLPYGGALRILTCGLRDAIAQSADAPGTKEGP